MDMPDNVIPFDPSFDRGLFEGSACAFGVFDGVHAGHRFLIENMVDAAVREGGRSVVITFDRDPDELFGGDGFRKLMSNERRIATLANLGVDAVVVLPFDRKLAAVDALAFLERTFGVDAPASMHVGSDFHFGARAAGDVGTLRFWADRSGTEVFAYGLETRDGLPVTSTRIRKLLAEPDGDSVERANALLTEPFAICGTIERGRGDGRDFGIRTANMRVPDELLAVAEGVYAAEAVVEGRRYPAAVNVGVALTFEDESTANIEAHLLDFDQEVYGQPMELRFLHFLRPMRRFGSTEELIATITADIARTRELVRIA